MSREPELLARVAQGAAERERVCAELYERFAPRVLAVCRRLTGQAADADDALQETFADVWRGLPGFQGRSAIGTWIVRIAVRASERVRSRRARGPSGPLTHEPAAPSDARPVHRDEAARVLSVMQTLPLEARVVLSLFAVEGLPHREIAAVLGIPEGTVWSRLHRARRMLAEQLERRPLPSSE